MAPGPRLPTASASASGRWAGRAPTCSGRHPCPLDPVEAVHRLAELGAAAVTFHDDDLVPRPTTPSATRLERFKKALADTGLRRRW